MSRNAPTWPMIRALGGVGCLCACLIATTYQLTLPTIERKKAIYLEKATYRALPGATKTRAFALNGEHVFVPFEEGTVAQMVCYAGYDENQKLVGIALEAAGQGFQDVIRILYGYDPHRQVLIGFQVLESRETPGLGDKIEKDPAFLANFDALDVAVNAEGALVHPLVMVSSGSKQNPWEIDAISGATITSRAITEILGKHSGVFPLIQNQLQVFEEEAP